MLKIYIYLINKVIKILMPEDKGRNNFYGGGKGGNNLRQQINEAIELGDLRRFKEDAEKKDQVADHKKMLLEVATVVHGVKPKKDGEAEGKTELKEGCGK